MPSEPFDGGKYLMYARLLIDTGSSETTCRIATSRAYYAAFWKARHLLESNGATFPEKKSHEFCWKSLGRIKNIEGETIREMGFALRDRRIHADYQDTPALEKRSAESDVQDAIDLIDALHTLSIGDQQIAAQNAQRMFLDYI